MATPAAPQLRQKLLQELQQELPERVVFFDGECAFCDGTVRWLIERDPEARLHFAPLQGETAARVRAVFADRFPTDLDTLVLLHPGQDGRPDICVRSAAVFEVLALAGGGWRWLRAFRVLPRSLTDLGYRLFARNRYRWFGRLEACDVPSARNRARALR